MTAAGSAGSRGRVEARVVCGPIDPFRVKRFAKTHPARVLFTLSARWRERWCRLNFSRSALPIRPKAQASEVAGICASDTAVTPLQMGYLVDALASTESLAGTVCVEVGSYRGVTTGVLASRTARKYVAVDPYIGYGGAEADLAVFRRRTACLSNVVHLRLTSGAAFRDWRQGPVGFVFIDAVHDYVNTSFDIGVWSRLLAPGGLLALHDTDNPAFAGTRRAAYEASRRLPLHAHVDGLVVLRKPRRV